VYRVVKAFVLMFTKKTVSKRLCNEQKDLEIGSGSYSTVYKIKDNDTSFINCFDYGFCPKGKNGWSILPKLYSDLHTKPPSRIIVRSIALQLLAQINTLHEHDIIHLDVKPANIMWKDSNMTSIQLIDFGSSRNLVIP